MTDAPVLSVRNLSATISGRSGPVRAVENVSFAINAGRTLAIVGEFGSGKTDHRHVADRPCAGRTRRCGLRERRRSWERELLGLSEKELRTVRGRGIGIVFQDPSASLNPIMSVGAQIGEAIKAAHRPVGGYARRACGAHRRSGPWLRSRYQPAAIRMNCPVASSSGSPSPWRLPEIPAC